MSDPLPEPFLRAIARAAYDSGRKAVCAFVLYDDGTPSFPIPLPQPAAPAPRAPAPGDFSAEAKLRAAAGKLAPDRQVSVKQLAALADVPYSSWVRQIAYHLRDEGLLEPVPDTHLYRRKQP